MPTKQSKYEWTKAQKPSTEARPLSPQMLAKLRRLLGMIGEADLAASLPSRFSVSDWDSKLSKSIMAKLVKLKRELDKHPSHRRKAAWSKSITVLQHRFAVQMGENGVVTEEPKAKAKAKPKAKKAHVVKDDGEVVVSEDERTMAIAIQIAKALKGLI